MERIAIVTDSTCDAAPEELEEWGVHCINLKVLRADGTAFPEGNTPEGVEEFFDYLDGCDELPSTSMPAPAEFGEMYSDLAAQGYTSVVSLHIASAMSGTVQAARLGAQSASIPVEVVDTDRNTWGLGLLVRYASILRDKGLNASQIVERVKDYCHKTDITFALETLRCLVKGGRVGKAKGLAATILDIKPILTVGDDGQVTQISSARSMKRAIKKLASEAMATASKFGPLEGYLVHVRNPKAVEQLRAAMREAGVPFKELGVRQVGPVIATHVGLGCVGFSYIPAED